MSKAYSTLFKLLLAQMVYEYGENKFSDIALALDRHPLLAGDRKEAKLTGSRCKQLYYELLEQEGIERDEVKHEQSKTKKAPKWVNQLAQTLYMAYCEQLLVELKKDEEDFIRVYTEIEKLKKGELDYKLAGKVEQVEDSQELQLDSKPKSEHTESAHETAITPHRQLRKRPRQSI